MAEYVDFHYMPLEGKITGKQVLKQTEDAINDLGQHVYEIDIDDEKIQEAIDTSNQAIETAETAMSAVTTNRAMWFNSVAELREANIEAGVTAATRGFAFSGDGGHAIYEIRQQKAGDVDNGETIVFLDNGNVAECIDINVPRNVDSVAELKSQALLKGYEVSTKGYYAPNNGDSAMYYIREKVQSESTDESVAYTKTVPADMEKMQLHELGGKTLVWNQLVDSGTATVLTISGRKYYTLIDGTASIVTSDGTAISVVDDTTDMVCDLTLMFGSGKEPATTDAFAEIFPATHYSYNAGTLLSAGVTEVVSKDTNNTTIDTYSVPVEVQSLDGYGWSAGNVYNYIDFERKKFVKRVARVDLGILSWHAHTYGSNKGFRATNAIPGVPSSGSVTANAICPKYTTIQTNKMNTVGADKIIATGSYWAGGCGVYVYDSAYESSTAADFKSAMSGTYLFYELQTSVETDISAYLTNKLLDVEEGGTITFLNNNGDDYRVPIPSDETFYYGDIEDGDSIIFLNNGNVAERIQSMNITARGNDITYVSNVAELIDSDAVVGNVYGTVGYRYRNDGGSSLYIIRAKTQDDVENGHSIIFLNNETVAELIKSAEIYDEESIKWALNNNPQKQFSGCVIVINNPIDISSYRNYVSHVTFSKCTFYLNSNLLTWTVSYTNIPRFENCVFYGNGNAIVDDDLYTSTSFFMNCYFDNVAFSKHGTFCQSPRFIGCRFSGETDFLTTNAVYDATFSDCQGESDFKGKLVVTEDGGQWGGATLLRLINCIFEGRPDANAKELFSVAQSSIVLDNCYFEALNGGLGTVRLSTNPDHRNVMIDARNCKFSWTSGSRAFIELQNVGAFTIRSRCQVSVVRCSYDSDGFNQALLSTYDIPNLWIHGSRFQSSYTRFNFRDTVNTVVNAPVGTWTFTDVTVPALTSGAYLIVWNYSYTGWKLNMAICGMAHNTPYACSLLDGTAYTVTDNGDNTWTVSIATSATETRMVIPLNALMVNKAL